MIEYRDVDEAGDCMEVDTNHSETVGFMVKYGNHDSNLDEKEGGTDMLASLDRDSVAALVGQLQSWLARTAVEAR